MSLTFLIFYIIFNYNGYGIIICDTNTSCPDMITCNVGDVCEINCYNEACAGKSIIVNYVDTVNITCNGLRTCQDMILHVNLTDEGIFNMDCNGKESCRNIHGTIISGNNGSISCFDSESCMDMSVIGIGLNGLNLFCDGDLACKSGLITLTTLNSEQNNTEVNINCDNGEKVCQDLEANGISIDNVNVVCHSSVHENECSGIQVYCPVNPNNINNSCLIDFNGAGDTSTIYAIYGVSQTFIENTNNDNIHLYCGFDWAYVLDFNKSVMDSTSLCDDQEFIQNNITNRIVNNDVILILYPNSNQILCDANHDCVIFILPNKNPINNVLCPMGSYFCSIYYSGSALSNAIIDGSESKTLSIHSKTGLTTMNSTINCPANIHSECRIIVDNPKIIDTYNYKTTINANNTEILNISGYGDQSLSNAVINAQNANIVYIECIGEQSCKQLSIYMYSEILQDIFNSTLFIYCIGTESCLNTKVTIESKYNISTCLLHTNNEWRCSHISKNITFITTLSLNTTLSLTPTIPLNTTSSNNTISTDKNTGNSFTMFFREYWLWIITAVVAFLCVGVCLCVIGTACVYQYRKRELEPEMTHSTIFSSTGTQSHNNYKSDSEIQSNRSTTIIYNGNYTNGNIIHTRNYNTGGRSTHLTVNPAIPNRNYLDGNDALNSAAQVPLSPTQNNSKTDTIIPGTAVDGMNLMTTLDFAAQVPLSPTNKSPNERSKVNPNIPRYNEHSKSNDFSFEYSKPKKFNPTNGEPSPSISSKRIKSEGIITPKVLHHQIGKYVNNTKDIIMEEPHIINNSDYGNDDNVEIISDLNV